MPLLHMETEQVRAAAQQLQRLAQEIDHQSQTLNRQLFLLQSSWQSPSGDQFCSQLQHEAQKAGSLAQSGFTLYQRVQNEVEEWETIDRNLFGHSGPISSGLWTNIIGNHWPDGTTFPGGITLPDGTTVSPKDWGDFWKKLEGEGQIVAWDLDEDSGKPLFGVKYDLWEGALYKDPDRGISVVGGSVSAKFAIDEDGVNAGLAGEYHTFKVAKENRLTGDENLGITGGYEVKALAADGFIGIKDNTLGATIGASLVTVEGEIGTNIAGANVGLTGEIGLKAEIGFQIGQETKVKLPFITIGFSLGKAK
ncbi:MAG: WXG100 family type VII secretion target [Anaerolineae bacterium]|nr:WXG100 family type VII secretion target [Anaerolineae bacterium]